MRTFVSQLRANIYINDYDKPDVGAEKVLQEMVFYWLGFFDRQIVE